MWILVLLCAAVSATSPPLPPKPICPGGIQEPLIPLTCGPNAYYVRCPSICSDVCPPTVCPCHIDKDCCRPRCICNDGYLRNDKTGICVRKEDCPIISYPTIGPPVTEPPIIFTIFPHVTGPVTTEPPEPNPPITIAPGTPSTRPPKITISPIVTGGPVEPNPPITITPGTPRPPTRRPLPPPPCGSTTIITSSESSASAQASASSESQSKTTIVKSGNGSTQSTSSSSSSSSSAASSAASSSSSTIIIQGRPCSSKCRPTCAVPNPPGCPYNPNNSSDPCSCKQGYILSEKGGKCIRVEECPVNLGCNGDPHAIVKECPLPCPSTCSAPNAIPCRKKCEPLGCECAPGYILSEHNGKCILPDDCPGGNPCGVNENFVSCKVPCPSDYCPAKDILRYPVCDPPNPCLSGCVCKHNYRRKSTQNPTCILAEKCPPVRCTRPNEEWFPCRPFCPRETCREATKYCSPPFVRTCDPRCTCCDGYFRNDNDVCIPLKQCPKTV